MGTMERYSKVGMQELDQRLSKIVDAALKHIRGGLSTVKSDSRCVHYFSIFSYVPGRCSMALFKRDGRDHLILLFIFFYGETQDEYSGADCRYSRCAD